MAESKGRRKWKRMRKRWGEGRGGGGLKGEGAGGGRIGKEKAAGKKRTWARGGKRAEGAREGGAWEKKGRKKGSG